MCRNALGRMHVKRIVNSPTPESELGHAFDGAEVVVDIERNDILRPIGNVFTNEPASLAGRDLWTEGKGCEGRVALGQGVSAHEQVNAPTCGRLQMWDCLLVLRKGRNERWYEHGRVQKNSHMGAEFV